MNLLYSVLSTLLLAVVLAFVVWVVVALLLTGQSPFGRHTPVPADSVFRMAMSVVAGVGGVVALVVAYRRQASIEDSRFRDTFAAAAAQLGSASAAERVAGVYAMAALADHQADRGAAARCRQCVDLLCGYLRLPLDGTPAWSGEREVRRTVISVMRQHLQQPETLRTWTHFDFDFSDVVFDGGSFDDSRFDGQVTFERARFIGVLTSFGNVEFNGEHVNFRYAQFSGGVVSFAQARFDCSEADFSGAQFVGATVEFVDTRFMAGVVRFGVHFVDAGPVGARFCAGTVKFDGSLFSGDRVEFGLAEFAGASVTFDRSQILHGTVDFSDSTIRADAGTCDSDGRLDLTGISFKDDGRLDLSGIRFTGGRIDLTQELVPELVDRLTIPWHPGGFPRCVVVHPHRN